MTRDGYRKRHMGNRTGRTLKPQCRRIPAFSRRELGLLPCSAGSQHPQKSGQGSASAEPGPFLLLTAVSAGSFSAASVAVDQVAVLAGFAQ